MGGLHARVANPGPMPRHGSRSQLSRAVLLACLLLTANAAIAGRSKEAFSDSPEWRRLSHVWQALLDHSCEQVHNPAIFQALAAGMYEVERDLRALTGRGELGRGLSDYLGSLFHTRYQYLSDYRYTTRSSVQQSPFEASRQAALWVVELQLSVLRRAALSKADLELAQAAESNLAYQLTYLYHMDRLASQVEGCRIDMRKREEAGEEIDWQAFDRDVERRQGLLLEAYKARKLPVVRVVSEASPYIIALTRSAQYPGAPGFPGP